MDEFLSGCPVEYKELLRVIDRLQFADTPDYDGMKRLLEQAFPFGVFCMIPVIKVLRSNKISADGPMDWETDEEQSSGNEEGPTDSMQTPTTQQRRV